MNVPYKTLVVNIFGGPGSGKSTSAAGVFHDLKEKGFDCELANEYAKILVWEKRDYTFEDQIYLFAKQYHRIFCLLNQVEVIITDCPILLTPVYDLEKRSSLETLAVDEHNKMWTYNVFMKRVKPYNPNGRLKTHDESTAKDLDKQIFNVLDKHNISFEIVSGDTYGKNLIVNKIFTLLDWKKQNETVNI